MNRCQTSAFTSATYLTQSRNISSWYADYAYFVYSYDPWFVRGGAHNNGLDAGAFSFTPEHGRLESWISFRLVLTPTI